jgi:hypothetical protein
MILLIASSYTIIASKESASHRDASNSRFCRICLLFTLQMKAARTMWRRSVRRDILWISDLSTLEINDDEAIVSNFTEASMAPDSVQPPPNLLAHEQRRSVVCRFELTASFLLERAAVAGYSRATFCGSPPPQ